MQVAEAALWLTSPGQRCTVANRVLTVTAVPLALSLQVIGPLLGAQLIISLSQHARVAVLLAAFGSLPIIGSIFVTTFEGAWCTTVTADGYLLWSYDTDLDSASEEAVLWLLNCLPWWLAIASPFLLWWRPLWQALTIAALGFFLFVFAIATTDSPASNWCLFLSFNSVLMIAWTIWRECCKGSNAVSEVSGGQQGAAAPRKDGRTAGALV